MNRWMKWTAAALLGGLLSAAPAQAQSASYKLDTASSLLYIKVFKDPETLGAGLSHDHAVKAGSLSGTAAWDPANPGACSVQVTVPVSSLNPDEPSMRRIAGLEGELDADDRAQVKEHMLGADQLNAASYPNITFTSTSCTASSISGNLTIRGKTKAVTVPMQIAADGSTFSAAGKITIRATDFGFQPFSALLGQLKNRNDMELNIKLVGKR